MKISGGSSKRTVTGNFGGHSRSEVVDFSAAGVVNASKALPLHAQIGKDVRRLLRAPIVEGAICFISISYLVLVLVDLVIDEMECSCSVLELEDWVEQGALHISNGSSACRDRLAEGGPACLSLSFVEEKTRMAVTVDVIFLGFFLLEICLRLVGEGLEYLHSVINSVDLVVILAGFGLDLSFLIGGSSTSFALVRLGRVIRVARVVNTLHRISKSSRKLKRIRSRVIKTVDSPPTCNWHAAAVIGKSLVRGAVLQEGSSDSFRNPVLKAMSRRSVRRSSFEDAGTSTSRARWELTSSTVASVDAIAREHRVSDTEEDKVQNASSAVYMPRLPFQLSPQLPFQLSPQRDSKAVHYACFLSHVKSESSADARYVQHMLQMLLKADVYLDSSNLTDLRLLFSEGVLNSDVVVLLASASVLSSPWVLLELWCASQNEVPVVVFYKPDFSAMAARRFLQRFISDLPIANPGALEELRSKLKDFGPHIGFADDPEGDLAGFTATIAEVLNLDEVVQAIQEAELLALIDEDNAAGSVGTDSFLPRQRLGKKLEAAGHLAFYPSGTDTSILVSLTALTDIMAHRTRRTLTWERHKVEGELDEDNSKLCLWLRHWWNRVFSRRKQAEGLSKLLLTFDATDKTASRVARYLQYALQIKLRGPVVIDSSASPMSETGGHSPLASALELREDMIELLDNGVRQAEAVLVVQTANTLLRPLTVMQIYEALRIGKPLICVHVAGGGYDFRSAKETLKDLRVHINREYPGSFHAMRSVLHMRGSSWQTLTDVLSLHVPNTISLSFQAGSSQAMCDALIEEIAERRNTLLERYKELSVEDRVNQAVLASREEDGRRRSVQRSWRSAVNAVTAVNRMREEKDEVGKSKTNRGRSVPVVALSGIDATV